MKVSVLDYTSARVFVYDFSQCLDPMQVMTDQLKEEGQEVSENDDEVTIVEQWLSKVQDHNMDDIYYMTDDDDHPIITLNV